MAFVMSLKKCRRQETGTFPHWQMINLHLMAFFLYNQPTQFILLFNSAWEDSIIQLSLNSINKILLTVLSMSSPHLCCKPYNLLRDIVNKQPNNMQKGGDQQIFQCEIAGINTLRQQGKIEEALNRVDHMIAKFPSQVRYYQIKGQIAFSLKQYEESLNCYQTYLARTDLDLLEDENNRIKLEANREENSRIKSLYQYNCGLCLQKLQRHEEAINALKEAAQNNKQKIEIYLALAQSYRKIRKIDKMMQIFQKLTQKTKGNSLVLKTIVETLLTLKDYKSILKLADHGLLGMKDAIKNRSLYTMLLSAKAKALRKLGEYQASIAVYLQVTIAAQEEGEVIDAYFRLADCYEKVGKIDETVECYQRILKAKPQSLEALNNLANLQIRQKKYSQAASLLDSALTQSRQRFSSSDQIKVLLLKSHRIVALMKIGKRDQASQDLKEVLQILAKDDYIEKEGESIKYNYRFIKDVIERYQPTLGKLADLQRETAKSQLPSQLNEEAKTISNLLINSIACELESKCTQQNELERLSQRINKLHKEILDFKLNTLKEHEISQTRVHGKIQQIEDILQRKEEQTNKLALEMEDLRKEYADLYGMISQVNAIDHKGNLSKAIKSTKESGKPLVALYAQELYWIFGAYFISIRLVANHLVSQGKHIVHLKGISSFFARFKSVFEVASHIPHIGAVCEAINSLLSLYLNQQSSFVYSQLNKAITRAFTSEKELQSALETAVLSLMKTDYVEQALQKSKKDKIRSEMTINNRAFEWFHKQKTKLIKKIVQFQEETADEILVKEQVIEDIGSILLYIIRSKVGSSRQPYSELLQTAFKKALLGNLKENEVNALYSKEQQKQAFGHEGGCSSKCQIY